MRKTRCLLYQLVSEYKTGKPRRPFTLRNRGELFETCTFSCFRYCVVYKGCCCVYFLVMVSSCVLSSVSFPSLFHKTTFIMLIQYRSTLLLHIHCQYGSVSFPTRPRRDLQHHLVEAADKHQLLGNSDGRRSRVA